jgi:FHA domain-containing protein
MSVSLGGRDPLIEVFVVSYSGSASGASTSAVFDSAGGTIGRGAGNHLTLSDPDRHLSRVQAKIVGLSPSTFEVSNLSRANSLFVGTNEVEPLQRATGQVGAELRMGLYVLGTRVSQGAARGANEASATTVASVISATHSVPDPFAMATEQRAAKKGDPFLEILGSPTSRPPDIGRSNEMTVTPTPQTGSAQKSGNVSIPDDFDPFSMPSAASRNGDNPIADLAKSSEVSLRGVFEASTHINQLVDSTPTPPNQHAPQPLFDDASSSLNDSVSSDPLQLFGGGSKTNNANDPFSMLGVGDHASELSSFLTLPKVETPSAASFTQSNQPLVAAVTPVEVEERRTFELPSTTHLQEPLPPVVSDAIEAERVVVVPTKPIKTTRTPKNAVAPPKLRPDDTDEPASDGLVRAFMEGAGVASLDVPDATDEAFMRRVGAMLRASIDGTVDLISARASTKREVRADVTMIVSRGNNPIKFAPDGEAAAMQLLGTPFPGFMPPVDSMQDAFDDLRAHQIGVIAGSRAAFAAVLQRFDPASLEEKLGAGGVLGSLMPKARKAKLWSLYTELFREILKQAEDDYGTLFSEQFRRAYEDEVERVRGEKRERGAR